MEQKTITFYDESYYYYTSNSCRCCEPQFWECWNTDNPLSGSCHSREDCYISAMQYFGYPIVEMTEGDCYSWSEDELESIAREWGIVLDFVS